MRIIGGQFKGRRLRSFQAAHIRPTTDRVKESVFNILMHELEGASVLDLYAGTGNLTCEAISRGASFAVAVELSKKSLHILKQNLQDLKIEDRVKCMNSDVMAFLRKYQGEPFDLIFCDPPFTEKLAHATLSALSQSRAVGPQTRIVIEYSRHERLDESYDALLRYTNRPFGDKSVAFFQPRAEDI